MRAWSTVVGAVVGASSAAVALPVALLLTVVLAAQVAGGGGFGGLSQLADGPRLPGVSGQQARAASPLDAGLPSVPARPGTTGAARTTSSPGGTAATPRGNGGTHRQTTTGQTTPTTPTQGTTTATVPQTTATSTPQTTASTTSGGTTTTTPARTNPLRELVRTVQKVVVEPLPLVGKGTSDAVGSVADLLLPPPGTLP